MAKLEPISQMLAKQEYRRWKWFYDRIHLFDQMAFSYHRCSYDLPPKTPEEKESFDYFFIEQSKLTAKGWESVSINTYSPMERELILAWAKQRGKLVYVADPYPDAEIWAFIGTAQTASFGLTMDPSLMEDCETFLTNLTPRPCAVVFEGCKQLPAEAKRLLRGRNVLIAKGRYGIAVSHEMISKEADARLAELAQSLSKREEAPKPLQHAWCYSSNGTHFTVNLVTAA